MKSLVEKTLNKEKKQKHFQSAGKNKEFFI